jgi:hypothetical protein
MDTEIAMNRLDSLLHAIAKLYSGIVASLVHKRTTSYRPGSDDTSDIGAALHAYIKQVKQRATETPSNTTDPALQVDLPSDRTSTLAPGHDAQTDNPLSNYFKKNNSYSELAQPIGEKLKSSAWEHTHSAIRFAHQGDYATAKLHADLANNAIHELSHFMSTDDFETFKRAVKDELLGKT